MGFDQYPPALIVHVSAAAPQMNWIPTAISIISVVIALGALTVTFAKYRMDLYDRRFAIYTATLDLFQALFKGDNEEIAKAMPIFVKGVRESQFLFSEKSKIFERLEEFRDNATKVAAYYREIAKPNPSIHRWEMDGQKEADSHEILEEWIKDLEKRLRPYLTYRVSGLMFWRN